MCEQKKERSLPVQSATCGSDSASMQSGRATAHIVSTVVGKIGCEALDQILENHGRLFEAFNLVWVCGTAAAGKSTVTRYLQSVYPDIPVIHDRHALVEAIRERSETNGSKSLPTVVDRDILCSAFSRVAQRAENSPVALIELGRGRSATAEGDENATRDPMSLSFALNELPPSVLTRSLFLYLSAPLSERVLRNSQRPQAEDSQEDLIPNVRCSDDTMLTVFNDIDADALLDREDLNFIELRNVVGKEHFMELLEFLFGGST